MAKFVVAGKVDCAAYARAEMLAEQMQFYLPDFHVHKIAVRSEDWMQWVKEECEERGWGPHVGDVLVWRELVKRGGRGLYLGGLRQFEDYASHYHDISPLTDSSLETRIAEENRQTCDADRLEAESRAKPHPLKVVVTSASSSLAYHLLHCLALGDVFGSNQLISIYLLDTPTHSDELLGVAMEITDMASPVVESVQCTSSLQEAFSAASFVFVLEQWTNGGGEGNQVVLEEGKPVEMMAEEVRQEEEEVEEEKEKDEVEAANKEKEKEESEMAEEEEMAKEKEEEKEEGAESEKSNSGGVLAEVANFYHKYGATLDFCAQKSVRVVVTGHFSNLGAALIAGAATSLPPSHIIASPCLREQRTRSIIARRLNLNTADVQQVCIWGRCEGGGEDVIVDVSTTRVCHYKGAIVGPDPFSLPLSHCLHNTTWLANGLKEEVKKREVEERRGRGLSEAVAITDMVRQWMEPEKFSSEVWRSVGVVSDGNNSYGFPVGVVCSIPVKRDGDREWKVVSDMKLSSPLEEELARQRKSLGQELEEAVNYIGSKDS